MDSSDNRAQRLLRTLILVVLFTGCLLAELSKAQGGGVIGVPGARRADGSSVFGVKPQSPGFPP